MVTAATLQERALQAAAAVQDRQAADAERRVTLEHEQQREWVRRALEARFAVGVPEGAIQRVSPTCLSAVLDGDALRLHCYPVSGSVRLAGAHSCGHPWESGDICDVQALGFALLRRSAETVRDCYRCQHAE